MRNCWKALLLAALLTSLLGWVGDLVQAHGKQVAQRAYDAHMAAFYAENPRPEDEQDAISWAYFDEWLAQYDAQELYDSAFLPWQIGRYAIDLADSLFSAVVLVGLYTGLLMSLRGGDCTPACVFSGRKRWKAAMWLSIRVGLNTLGWGLLAMIPAIMLDNWLGEVGALLGTLLVVGVVLWAECHYALSGLHLAEDADGALSASACISAAVADMNFFTIRRLLRTAWPVWALMAAGVVLAVAAELVPLLAIPALLFSLVSDISCLMLLQACYTCIYEELRAHPPVKKARPDDEDDE